MNSVHVALTKSDEIELLGATIASLPDGYLRDILTESRGAIVSAIRSDLGFAGIGEMIANRAACLAETKQALQDVESKLADRTEALRKVERMLSHGVDSLGDACRALETVSGNTSGAYSSVRRVYLEFAQTSKGGAL